MSDLKQAARALDGEVSGGQIIAPGPNHSHKDRSLCVKFDAAAPDGFVVYSHAGDDPIRCRDHVRSCLNLPAFGSGLPRGSGQSRLPTRRPAPIKPIKLEPDRRALELWNSGDAVEGSLAETYLREHRGITIEHLPVTLRFAEVVRHPHLGIYLPAMIAALASPGHPVTAVQVTFLNAKTAAKASISTPKVTIGKMHDSAVHLGWPDDVLGLAEGVETTLSATQIFEVPCWAVLGATRMSVVTIPDTVKELHLFADNDEAGNAAAMRAVDRFTREGKHVVQHIPPDGHKDWNDVRGVQL